MHIIGFPLCRILVTIRNQATIVPFLVYALLTIIELTRCFLVFLVPQLDQVLQGQRLENPGYFNAMDEGEGDGWGVGEDLVKFALNARVGRKGADGKCTAKPEQLICFVFSFYSTPHRGQVYKWKFCLSICPFVCLSVITSYFFPFLSDSKLRRVTQPLPRYPMSPSMSPMPPPPHSPVNWSPNEQDHLADLF